MEQPLALRLWLLHACFSASSGGEGPVHSWLALLWYLFNPLFCEWARLRIRLEPFEGKFSSFFPSLTIPQFGLLSHVSSLRLSQGHSGPVLTLSTDYTARASLLLLLSRFSHVRLFVTPWTVALQAPLSMGFSRQEYWSELPFPSPYYCQVLGRW